VEVAPGADAEVVIRVVGEVPAAVGHLAVAVELDVGDTTAGGAEELVVRADRGLEPQVVAGGEVAVGAGLAEVGELVVTLVIVAALLLFGGHATEDVDVARLEGG